MVDITDRNRKGILWLLSQWGVDPSNLKGLSETISEKIVTVKDIDFITKVAGLYDMFGGTKIGKIEPSDKYGSRQFIVHIIGPLDSSSLDQMLQGAHFGKEDNYEGRMQQPTNRGMIYTWEVPGDKPEQTPREYRLRFIPIIKHR